ncbi:MAG TPA: hypothetical protein VKE74_35415, partial [Gemmataceae bacterium]|nr:hypothetical protein [Gemmataceae bacterium]
VPGGALITERELPKDLVATTAFCPDAGVLPLAPPPEVAPPPSPILPSAQEWAPRIGQPPER